MIHNLRFTRDLANSRHLQNSVIALIAFVLLLTSCRKSNSTLRKQVVGTWIPENNRSEFDLFGIWTRGNNQFELALDMGGTFHSQGNSTNSVKWIKYFGTWAIKNGNLRTTLTNIYSSGFTNLEKIGNIDSYKILQADDFT
ncbi:MAG TPA: hypothetical protein VMJ12_17220, partial [Candidatus Acidoferrales bacterium]|nr:hypothetical protein [Candidatus Acidoferrales bacterium]